MNYLFTEGNQIMTLFLLMTAVLSLVFAIVYFRSDTDDIDELDKQFRDEDGDHYYYDHTRIWLKRKGK